MTGRDNLKQGSQGAYVPQRSAFQSVDAHSDCLPLRQTRRYEVEQPSPNYKHTHQTSVLFPYQGDSGSGASFLSEFISVSNLAYLKGV